MPDRSLTVAAGRPWANAAVHEPNDASSDFRPTSLVSTLSRNMTTAAVKAHKSGRYGDAASKFDRAVAYLESSTSEYGDDPEMIQWTRDRLAWLRASADIAYDMDQCLTTAVGRDGPAALESTKQRRPPRPAARSAIAAEKTNYARASPLTGRPACAGAATASALGRPPPCNPSVGITKKRGTVWTSPLTGVPTTRSLSPGISMRKVASSVLGVPLCVPLRRTRSQQSAAMPVELNDGDVLEGVRLTRSVTSELACLNLMSLTPTNAELMV